MTSSRNALLALPIALGLALAGACATGASAQQGPIILPGARLPDGSPLPETPPLVPNAPGGSSGAPRSPAQARPVAVKLVTEEAVLGRELKLNGSAGSLRLERAGEIKARIRLAGTRPSKPGEACTVDLGAGAPTPLAAQGRPAGVLRYEAQDAACPLTLDLLDGAVLVGGPASCTLEAADCRADPRGLWGPEPGALVAQAQSFEQARAAADKALNENFKALTQRAKPGEVRAVVAERAAFSSERETLCRGYAREAAHGFCGARFTEARAASLAARLGVADAPATPRPGEPRRRRAPEPTPPPAPPSN